MSGGVFGFSKGSAGSGCCGSGGKRHGTGANSRESSMASPTVLKKVESAAEFQSLSRLEKNEKALELTSPSKIWEIYFSGCVLDPARDEIEAGLDSGTPPQSGNTKKGKVSIKLEMQPIISSGNYGLQGQVSSLLLRNYGSLHASLLVADAVVLEWNTAGLVVPGGKPIMESRANPAGGAEGAADAMVADQMSVVIEEEFEAALAKKTYVDRIIGVIVKFNKFHEYDPIMRNCQTFVADVFKELKFNVPAALEGKLGQYYKQLKDSQAKKCRKVSTHEELDVYVQECLERELPMQTMEYLLFLYFRFHITSLASSANPRRWSCERPDCLRPRLEQRINKTETLANQILH